MIHILYHANCSDGLMAAAVALHAYGDSAAVACHPVVYGAPVPEGIASTDGVLIVDFSYPPDVLSALAMRCEWVEVIDHHASAIDKLAEFAMPNVQLTLDTTRSGAGLVWQRFFPESPMPLAVRWVQDRDLWQWAIRGTREFSFGIRTMEKDPRAWVALLDDEVAYAYKNTGAAAMAYYDENLTSELRNAVPVQINGHRGLALNTAGMFASDAGSELSKQSGTFGCVWYVGADGRVKVSLRSNDGFSARALAEAYGGGGHEKAAGCTVSVGTLLGWVEAGRG